MSADFEWRFGDEFPEDHRQRQRDGSPRWRRWLPGLLALLIVAAGLHLWYSDRQRTLTQAEARVQQVARLELRALEAGDAELYLSLQDPTDRSWREAQEVYLDSRGLPLPLQNLTTPISTTVESGRVVGNRAQVDVVHRATLPSGEEAIFRAVRFYRYTADGRWLHTSIGPDDGGHSVVFVVDAFEVKAFDEDADWLNPLVSGLAVVTDRYCGLVPCQVALPLRLDLAADLERGGQPHDPVLPAPFLLGAPYNDAARQAWEASLGQFLVDYVVTREIGPRPENEQAGGLVEERLRAWLKAQLDVSEPAPPNLELVGDAVATDAWIPLWRLWFIWPDDPERPLAGAELDLLLAFVENERGPAAIAGLFPHLRDADRLEGLLRHVGEWRALEERFPAYVRRETASSTDSLSAFADYDVVIGCDRTDSLGAGELWGLRLDRANPTLLHAPARDPLLPISWSPDGRRLLLQRSSGSSQTLIVLRAGSGFGDAWAGPEGSRPVGFWLADAGWSPDGKRLAYHVPARNGGHPIGSTYLETEIAALGGGERIALDGYFIGWSPSGSDILYSQPSESHADTGALLHNTGIKTFYVARNDGTAPRWIGEGYVSAWSPDGVQIVTVTAAKALTTYDLTSGRRTTLLDAGPLLATSGVTRPLVVDQPFRLAWSPDADVVALGVTARGNEGARSNVILLADGAEHRLLHREPGGIVELAWAPNGRWLTSLVSHGATFWTTVVDRDGALVLHEERTLVTWSPDARYAALTRFGQGRNGLHVLDLATGQRKKIDVSGYCRPPIWNPRGPAQRTTGGSWHRRAVPPGWGSG